MSTLFVPTPQYKLSNEDGTPSADYYRFFQGLTTIFSANGVLKPTAGGTGIANALTSTITVAGPFVVASHGVTFSVPAAGLTMTLPSSSTTLMAFDFSNASGVLGLTHGGTGNTTGQPSGAAGGDLSSNYPNPTVAKINGTVLGSTTATSGNILVANGSQWASVAMSGGATINSSGVVTLSGSLPPSGTAGGDLSGSYPNPTVAKINGAGLGTTTATAGNVLIGDGTNWQTRAISGSGSLSSTGVLTITHGATFQGSPTNATCASGSVIMMGLAGSITPATSGTIVIGVFGYASQSNSGGTIEFILRRGTGSAPAHGDASTGANVGPDININTAATNQRLPIASQALVTGLSVGTTYWLDIAADNGGAGTISFTNLAICAFEI